MAERGYGEPDACIMINRCSFSIWVGEKGIKRIRLPDDKDWNDRYIYGKDPLLSLEILSGANTREGACLESLLDYFTQLFNGVEPAGSPACSLDGLSDFTVEVLRTASRISWGSTRSYSWIANELKKGGAARAVGAALGRNPLPAIIPCHRVIRLNGEPGGYSYGPSWKKRLLAIESKGRTNKESGAV